ncbi:hypothetical protein KSF73_02265 [Burkholderiaceae bacterium DAT-1]|nr:hypothetical protein [Burkholderiaceae bacterium DAT-1]
MNPQTKSTSTLGGKKFSEITYTIDFAKEVDDFAIRITSTSGGIFGTEPIPFGRIESILSEINEGSIISPKQLQPAYLKSRSCNNGYYLAAILINEEIITKGDKKGVYLLGPISKLRAKYAKKTKS